MEGSVRAYRAADESSWLRCRVLGFLDTDYHDDVKRIKTALGSEAIELVVDDGREVGCCGNAASRRSTPGRARTWWPTTGISVQGSGRTSGYHRVHVCRQYVRPVTAVTARLG